MRSNHAWWLALLLTIPSPALPAAAEHESGGDSLSEQFEERELVVHFPESVLALSADGIPTVLRFLEARHPELRRAGTDRDGLHRFLVSPEYSDRIGEYRRSLAGLGGTVGKTMPSPRLQQVYKARVQARRLGEPDVLGLIVRYRSAEKRKQASESRPLQKEELSRMARITGKTFQGSRPMYGEAYVANFDAPTDLQTGEMLALRLAMSPDVERVDLNTREAAALVPNDEFFGAQWSLTSAAAGIRAPQAWDITTGSSNVAVGVVDSGILGHPDLTGRILPGIDTITSATTSNDGDGRDNDPTDAGTFAPPGTCGSASLERSSWHGTHVAGIIAANANNGSGIAGVDWRARIVPVRSLGRCGSGTTADIIDGIAWAAGLAVPGLPVNANPARVVNASLTGEGDCSAYASVLQDLLRKGALLIAAAGNNNRNALEFRPATCALALTVSAVGPSGDKASYSNYSSALEISAPGGDQATRAQDGIASTSATGEQGSPGEAAYVYMQGTSQAAPHVSGVASLMLSVAPSLTVGQMRDVIQDTARAYPAGSRCATQRDCAAGLLDAAAAVTRARSLNGRSTNYSALWWNPSESGWGVNLQQQGNIVFGTWFTYASDNSALWYVMPSLQRVTDGIFSGPVYVLTGVPFNQISGQPAMRTLTEVATATVSFFNDDRAFFHVEVNGATAVFKQLQVQLFATRPSCDFATGSRAALVNYQDLWWNPSESGWGINLAHQNDIIFATWFTYDGAGNPLWLVADQARRTAANTYSGKLYLTTGRRPQDIGGSPSIIAADEVGTITLTFQDGERGTFSYNVQGSAGSKPIQRQVWSSPLSNCR